MNWKINNGDPARPRREAPKKMGKDYLTSNGVSIELTHHYGSEKAFGASKWPHLRLDVSFTVDEGETGRDRFADALQAFLDGYFAQPRPRNPFRKETWNLTEQMRLCKSDPQLAARLREAAK